MVQYTKRRHTKMTAAKKRESARIKRPTVSIKVQRENRERGARESREREGSVRECVRESLQRHSKRESAREFRRNMERGRRATIPTCTKKGKRGGGGGRTGEQRERTGEQSEYTDYREREAQRLAAHVKPGDFGKWDSSTQGRLVVTE